MRINKSPRPERLFTIPFPRSRKKSPELESSGILTKIAPSRVSIFSSPPISMVEIGNCNSIKISLPSLRKTGCGVTPIFTYKSPEVPPKTSSPIPTILIISPFCMPGGISISKFSCFLLMPAPLQDLHKCSGISPRPRQEEHSARDVKTPKIDFRLSRIVPVPWHISPFFFLDPTSEPDPPQTSQFPERWSNMLRLAPKTDSAKDMSIAIEISLPRLLLCPWRENPPKKVSNTSPKSSAPKPHLPPPNPCEKSPENPPAVPNWSYCRLLESSPKT